MNKNKKLDYRQITTKVKCKRAELANYYFYKKTTCCSVNDEKTCTNYTERQTTKMSYRLTATELTD